MKTRFWFGLVFGVIVYRGIAIGAEPPDNTANPQSADSIVDLAMAVQPSEQLLAQQPAATPTTPAAPPTPTTPGAPSPEAAPPEANALALAQPPANDLSMSDRTSGYSLASSPNMIGDTLGVGFHFVAVDSVGKAGLAGNVPLGDGTIKISEDCSPLPVDRVFFDYNHFENALVTANGADISLDRYTLGVEKTFLNGLGSVEFKLPFDSGLSATQTLSASTPDNQGTLLGTMAITPKLLLFQNDNWAASAGCAVGLPTSPRVGLNTTANQIVVFDDSVHVAPFVGLLLTPNQRWFSITYLQFDFDSTGDHVTFDGMPSGTLRDPTLMYVDCSVGYWLFYNEARGAGMGGYVTGLAPIVELHYTRTLSNAQGAGSVIQPESDQINALNLTGGLFFKLGSSAGLTVAGVAPLRTSPSDKQFDAEVLVQFNRWFY